MLAARVSDQAAPAVAADDGTGYAGKAALERRTISFPGLENQPTDTLSAPGFLQEKFAIICRAVIAKERLRGP